FFQPRVRQVEPLLQKVHAQHPLQPYRGPPVAGLGIVRLDQRTQLAPRHHLLHLFQKQRALGLLGVPLKASHHRQCPLFHAGANLTYTPCGKGELNQSLPSTRASLIAHHRGAEEVWLPKWCVNLSAMVNVLDWALGNPDGEAIAENLSAIDAYLTIGNDNEREALNNRSGQTQ